MPEQGEAGLGVKAARNEIIFLEVNERIPALSGSASGGAASLFICECSRPDCAEAIEITLAEYEAVRAHGARKVVPGHQREQLERVTTENGRFAVIEKLGGAAEPMIDNDPGRV